MPGVSRHKNTQGHECNHKLYIYIERERDRLETKDCVVHNVLISLK